MISLKIILLTIQIISILALYAETWIVFRTLKSRLHSILLFSCVATLINNTGYLLQMNAKTEEGFLTALQFSYAGRIWIALSLFFFAMELGGIRLPDLIRSSLLLLHVLIYAVILTLRYNTLFYSDYSLDFAGDFPVFIHGNGIFHHIHIFLVIVYIFFGMYALIRAVRREKDVKASMRLQMVILAYLFQIAFFLVQMFVPWGFTKVYDVTMIGYTIGIVFMLTAILQYDLLGTGELAREFMVDRLSEGIIAVDPFGDVRYYNDHAKELYPDIDKDGRGTVERIRNAIDSGQNITIGDHIYSPEENELLYEGEDYGRLYALVDETEHLKYMEMLQKQKDNADSANRAKSMFLANMSHEIRTPINAVLGMDEMILRETREKAIRSYATDIMSAGRTLLSLIGDILDLSKVEEGRMEIIPVEYELSSLAGDLVNLIAGRAAGKGLAFNTDIDEDIPNLLKGDEVRIRQCVLNLLTNAVKYTDKGSVELKISFSKLDSSHIMLEFTVSDTGIGIKEEHMEDLFQPYRRMDEMRNRGIEGTGLGMAITKQLLALMGSELMVKSEYGKGSQLSFCLEQEVIKWDRTGNFVRRYQDNSDKTGVYRELFHAPDARILVVDDIEMNLTVIQNFLKKTGIRIDTAGRGDDALTLATSNVYDVMFIDHMMPDMNGIELLQRIRAKSKNRNTPAVALTANAVSGAREMYRNAGFSEFVSKPVDGRMLEKLLYVMLPDEKIKEVLPEGSEDLEETACSVILVVDDDSTVGSMVRSIMEPLYEVKEVYSGKETLKAAKDLHPSLILLDINLNDANGFEVMKALRDDELTADIPVLLMTGDEDSVSEESGFRSGASDYIRKPFVPDVLRQRIRRIIELHHYQKSIEEEVERQTRKSMRLTREMMLALSKTVDTKDHYTDGHSRRVAAMSAELGRRLGKTPDEQIELYEIGLLHDIGKIGVHEDIIHKSTKLTEDEFGEIKEHTIKGYEILKEIADMPRLSQGARWHHERFGGGGYPDGLRGGEIPETARIVCVADCYDAMTSTRSYSVPKSQEQVRAEIVRCRGTFFDPVIADVMLAMIDEDKDYRMNEHASSADVWKEYDRLWKSIAAEKED